jgi:RNA polymerase sigma factor (sigma-70 family)
MELTLNARPVSAVQDDSRLVAAARQGDDRAFEQLYARYRERIYAFILSKVRDHGRAEDIAQDVFMSALRQMRCTDQDLAFKPWLYTIARNACIDEFRRGSRAAEVPVESEEDLDASAAQGPFVTAVPTPDSAVESKQNLDDLRGAFEGLTESQHQLLVLREFEGRSYDEIGDRLGMTKQMVESGLFRARRKLSEEYDELASGRRCEQIQTAIDAGTLRVAKGMGIRDRRRYARHLAHCQPCRHVARMTGVDDTLLKPRRLVDKVAVLLPFPFMRRFFSHGGGASHAGAAGVAAQAGSVATTTGASIGAGQAATIAALAVAGAGGGLLATHAIAHHHHAAPAIHRTGPARAPSGTAVRVVDRSPVLAARHAVSAATTAHRTLRHAVIPASVVHARVARQSAVTAAPTVSRHPAATEHNPVATAPGATAPTATTPTATAPTATTPTATTAGATTRTLTTTVPTAPRATRSTPISSTPTPPTATTPTIPTTADPVQKTVDGTAGAVNGTVGAVGGAVNGTVNAVGSTVNGVASTVGSTVNGVAGGLTGTAATGTPASTTPTSTTPTPTTPVSSTVNGVTGAVTGTVTGVTGTVTGVVGGLLGTSTTSTTSGS